MSVEHKDTKTYSADGRITQVEYAMKAINLGTTVIGVRLADSVILISEKKLLSKLQNPKSIKKQYKIYDRLVAGVSGISGDAPSIIRTCVDICINHERIFNKAIPLKDLMKQICKLALQFSEDEAHKKIFSRPFGVSLLLASYEEKPKLFTVDPSGSFVPFMAKSIGSTQEVLEPELEKIYDPVMSVDECITKVLGLLKHVMKDKMTEYNVDVAVVDRSGVKMLVPEEILKYLQ
ncbi:20S proteasome subunit alpha 5 [Enteropsectra breve]|nr:20S proteasome subunit alpha 5 [Enteropsectra breve]